jgi:LysM repeat protein
MLLIFLMLFAGTFSYASPIASSVKQVELSGDSTNLKQDSLHIVKKGETLYSIAKDNSTTVNLIQQLNELKDSHIEIGQTLRVYQKPEKDTLLVVTTDQEAIVTELKDSVHVVSKGEYISGIAAKYSLSTKEIALWNKLLAPDKSYPGQALRLYPNQEIKLDSLVVAREVVDTLAITNKTKESTITEEPVALQDTTQSLQVTKDNNTQADTAINKQLSYDFNPGGIKTLLNVLVLVVLLVVFIYNIHK